MPLHVNNKNIIMLGVILVITALAFTPVSEPVQAPPQEYSAVPTTGYAEEEQAPAEVQLPAEKQDTPAPILSVPSTTTLLEELAKKLQLAQDELNHIRVSLPDTRTRIPQHELYDRIAPGMVNFFCDMGDDTIAVATGAIIDTRGYILTNAHVVETDGAPECLLRTGSPARNFAFAKRIFTAPEFSPTILEDVNLRNDVALWKIVRPAGTTPLPDTFSAIALNPSYLPKVNVPLATFSYPAELFGSQIIVQSLYLLFSETMVRTTDTFFVESAQSIGSQKGSSGGVLIDPFTGDFAGLIFAIAESKKEPLGSVSNRSLFSLTPYAINQAVYAGTGKTLAGFLATNP